jgi:paired small multidrug resistance pump
MSNMMWHDWTGLVGVALVLIAFFLLQAHRLSGQGHVYQVMNLLGAFGILLSLIFGMFNLSAFLQEMAWFLISVYGIVRGARARRARREAEATIGPVP